MHLRHLPHVVVATLLVAVLPAVLVAALLPAHDAWSAVASVLVVVGLSLAIGRLAAGWWMRHPLSRELVFADLMLWGWLRRGWTARQLARAERRIAAAQLSGVATTEQDLQRLGRLLEARDASTHGHSQRVARHAARIARGLHLPPEEVAQIRRAASVHDIGKLYTPREILYKPGRLTDDEYGVVQEHARAGAEILEPIVEPTIVAMVLHHHERLDGRGYPERLAGEQIPLGARIIAVADTFDAITSQRVYRSASSHKHALDVLAAEAGTQLDAAAVAVFIDDYAGRRSVAVTALGAAVPPRLATLLSPVSQVLGGAAAIGQALTTAGAAAVIGLAPALSADVAGTQQRIAPGSAENALATPVAVRLPAPVESADPAPEAPTSARPGAVPAPAAAVQPAVPAQTVVVPSPPGVSNVAVPAPSRVSVPDVRVPSVQLPGVAEVPAPRIERTTVATPAVSVPPIGTPAVAVPASSVTVPAVQVPAVSIPSVAVKLPAVGTEG